MCQDGIQRYGHGGGGHEGEGGMREGWIKISMWCSNMCCMSTSLLYVF